MDLAAVATSELNRFLLCLARTGGMVAVSPVFGGRFVPAAGRGLLAVVLALVVFPLVPPVPVPASAAGYALALLAEVLAGLALGLVTVVIFAVAQTAGQWLDLSAGFGLSGAFDPVLGQPAPVLGNFFHLAMAVVFLAADGHHLVIRALVDSFRRLPVAGAGVVASGPVLVDMVGWMWLTALQLCLPVLGVLLALTAGMALMARAVPQLNVLVTGLPVQMVVGLVATVAVLPALLELMGGWTGALVRYMGVLLGAMAR